MLNKQFLILTIAIIVGAGLGLYSQSIVTVPFPTFFDTGGLKLMDAGTSGVQVHIYNNGAVAGNFRNNGGNGSFLVNAESTDFASTIVGFKGTMCDFSTVTNSQQLCYNSSGGDGNAQLVTTHSGTGNTVPLEIFWDSTKLATFTSGSITFSGVSAQNIRMSAGVPAIFSCGTGSVTSGSTDFAGEATSTGATVCQIAFSSGTVFSTFPFCVVTEETSTAALKVATAQASFTVSNLVSGDKFMWFCSGR